MKRLTIMIILLLPLSLLAQGLENSIHVHFYPSALSAQDNLRDGPNGKKIDIRKDTFLIWVDFYPGMFFAHETCYILITEDRARTVRGSWWPVLNGKMILHNELGKYALMSPFELPLISSGGYINQTIEIHVYPHELTSQDSLTDGPYERLIRIDDNCLLIWVDFLPEAYFAHPTAHILVSNEGIRVEDGSWWPTLNGRTILYGEQNKTGILSPFKVTADNLSNNIRKRD